MNWKDMIGTTIGDWEILERDYYPTSKQHSTFFKCRCKLCGEIYSVSRDSLVKGASSCCNHCKGAKIKESLKAAGYSIIDERIPIGTRFGMLVTETASYYRDDRDKKKKYIKCKCDCGNEVEVRVDHLEGRIKQGVWEQTLSCGCKNISNGELRIKECLEELGLDYKMQYREPAFNILSPFDFAIFNEDGIRCFIEYDGEQHYRPIDYFGGEEKFNEQRVRDAAKDDYCAAARIKLIRIGYMDFKNINSQYLKELIDEC